MSHTGTLRTARATSSTDEAKRTVTIDLKAPTSWKELSQEQLRIVLDLLAKEQTPTAVKTYMLVYFCGLHVMRKTRHGWKFWVMVDGRKKVIYLRTSEIRSFTRQFDFIDQLGDMDCRLDAVCGLHAVDVLLHRVSFNDYLMAEKYYQMFVSTKNFDWIENVAMWLYRGSNGLPAGTGKALDDEGNKVKEVNLTPGERLGTLSWYMHVKKVMTDHFPHFFHPGGEEGSSLSGREIQRLYDIQLRALTGGDPTKEAAVLALDCWRALTELDAKARETKEWEKRMKN